MEKMVIIRKSNGKEEIIYILDEVLQINKENSELVRLFSELVKVTNKNHNLDEEYRFGSYKNDSANASNYFNDVMKGNHREAVGGSFHNFVMAYMKRFYKEDTEVFGLNTAQKMHLAITKNTKGSKKK